MMFVPLHRELPLLKKTGSFTVSPVIFRILSKLKAYRPINNNARLSIICARIIQSIFPSPTLILSLLSCPRSSSVVSSLQVSNKELPVLTKLSRLTRKVSMVNFTLMLP